MVVGEDVAAGADDDATAETDLCFVADLIAKKEAEPRVFGVRCAGGDFARADADDRPRRRFGSRTETAGCTAGYFGYAAGGCFDHGHRAETTAAF